MVERKYEKTIAKWDITLLKRMIKALDSDKEEEKELKARLLNTLNTKKGG